MPSKNLLLVLVDKKVDESKARREFRVAVEAAGGIWLTRADSLGEIFRQVQASAPGEFVLFLGENDEPVEDCLTALTAACSEFPLADVIYGDKQARHSRRPGPAERLHFPLWSPHRIRFEPFVGQSFLVRTSSLLSLAGAFDENNPWDSWRILQECASRSAHVAHARKVWFDRDNVSDHSRRKLLDAPVATAAPAPEGWPAQRCSLITLTAGASRDKVTTTPLFFEHLAAIRATDSVDAEMVVVVGHECLADVRQSLASDPNITVVFDDETFNFARRSNLGRLAAHGDILVFVNDDFVPMCDDWMERLTQPLTDPQVGVTGGTLLFEDETVQHLGVGIIAGEDCHFYRGSPLTDPRVAALVRMNREVDAVTGACLAIRADVFDHVGGLFEGFPLNYNDIDLCLKVRSLGLSIVHVGEPLGHHLESRTREGVRLPEEVSLFHARWPTRALHSEYSFDLFE